MKQEVKMKHEVKVKHEEITEPENTSKDGAEESQEEDDCSAKPCKKPLGTFHFVSLLLGNSLSFRVSYKNTS